MSPAINAQIGESVSSMQLVLQLGVERIQATRSNEDSLSTNNRHPQDGSSYDSKLRSDKEDVSRWQDDGGESGEDV